MATHLASKTGALRALSLLMTALFLAPAAMPASALPDPLQDLGIIGTENSIQIIYPTDDALGEPSALVRTPATWDCDITPILPGTPLGRGGLGTTRGTVNAAGETEFRVNCAGIDGTEAVCTPHASAWKGYSNHPGPHSSHVSLARCGHSWQPGTTAISCGVSGTNAGSCPGAHGQPSNRQAHVCVATPHHAVSWGTSCWWT